MAFTPKSLDNKGTPTNTGENGCKGCKCKKSECLKLYCDCFAAGTYCTDPCSCQGCLNTAEYEDTVLEAKKQIESRNRLAFLPKIVLQSNVLPSNNNDTEHASVVAQSMARHRRGCNCKKSMCVKKYCECYKAHIGCSNGCRCEGCKNEYGTKECCVAKDDLSNVGIVDQSSPCSSSNTKEWTNSNPQNMQPLDSDFDVLPATTSHSNYLCQMPLMENESHNANINMPCPAPGPSNNPPEQGLFLQPQIHIPRHQQLLSQDTQNHIAPQPNNHVPHVSGLAQTPSQNIGHNNYMFPGPQRQSSFLHSLLQQPNYNVQHSADDFMLQQHSQVIRQRQQQQSSIVRQQQQTAMAMGHQQPMLTAQQQHQITGPQPNDATNIQAHAPSLGPPNNVGDVEQSHWLFLRQKNLTDLYSEFPPYFF